MRSSRTGYHCPNYLRCSHVSVKVASTIAKSWSIWSNDANRDVILISVIFTINATQIENSQPRLILLQGTVSPTLLPHDLVHALRGQAVFAGEIACDTAIEQHEQDWLLFCG